MAIVADHLKIGVVGIYNSGKTVFLTSLINHLLHHDPHEFRLVSGAVHRTMAAVPLLGRMFRGGPVRIRKARPVGLGRGENPFAYDRYRDDLINHGVWPAKTCDASHYRLRFGLSHQYLREMELHFFDFPGERIADAAIAALDYGPWCDHILKTIENDGNYRDRAREFLVLQDGRPVERAGVLASYKHALAEFRKSYRPLISPSSFVLDAEGRMPDSRRETAAMIEGRFCGRGADEEFVPLGEAARRANIGLADEFLRAYERYKKELVLPALGHLRSCDRLIVLIDLPTILNAGPLMANDVHDITRDLLDFCEPGRNFLERFYALSGLPFLLRQTPLEWLANSKITRIAFVASKCDLVHEDDRDNLLILLKELLGNLFERHDGVAAEFFCASAVQATLSDPGSHGLVGMPELAPEGVSPVNPDDSKLVTVSRVPPHLPDHWRPGDFCFPDFRPRRFPGLKTRPPRQLGVDRVFNFIVAR